MPVIVAFFVRQLIIIGVQLGIFELIDKFVTPLLNDAISSTAKFFGVADTTAQDILHNEVLTTVESLGLTVAFSKARLPLAIADRLGFTTSRAAKVKLGADLDAKVARAKAGGGFGATQTVADEVTTNSVVAKAKGILPDKVKAVLGDIGLLVGGPLFVLYVVANFLDYGAWSSSAYKGTFRAIFAIIGLKPDAPLPSSRVLSPDMWKKVSGVFTSAGAYAINDPYKLVSEPFTTQNLIDLVDKVASHLQLETGKVTAAAVIGNTQALVLMSTPTTTPSVAATPTATGSAAGVATSVPSVKVFTGIVSQGVLGSGLSFTARPDDLIQSVSELQDAAANNLAATLAALPGQLTYEIKIVSSVVTKDGFRQTGTSQQIVSGYHTNGTPKYRTVVNRFATLAVYLTNEKGTRTKIRSIVLGPTDVTKFNPTSGQVAAVEASVKNTLTTSSTADISHIVTNTPVSSIPAQSPTTPAPQAAPVSAPVPSVGAAPVPTSAPVPKTVQSPNGLGTQIGNVGATPVYKTDNGIFFLEGKSGGSELQPMLNFYFGAGATFVPIAPQPAASAPKPVPAPSICTATTLYELSVAQGVPLPKVAQRAPDYERLGLGQAAYYTGTAEQNIKLLAALQRELGCPNA